VKYLETLISHCVDQKKNPIYFVRYEDLMSNPQDELVGVLKYLLDVEDLSGTVAEARIKDVVKSIDKKQDVSAHSKFTSEQTTMMKESMAHLLYYFGYTNHKSEQNSTDLFKFDLHEPKHLENFKKFKQHNTEMIVSEPREAGDAYKINSDEAFDVIARCDRLRVQEPVHQKAEKSLGWPEQDMRSVQERASEKARQCGEWTKSLVPKKEAEGAVEGETEN